MLPYFSELYGNAASSGHAFGWAAADAVDRARTQLASCLGVEAKDIIFTSGATESNNLAIKGVARAGPSGKNHLVTVASEHKAVLDPMRRLAREGFEVSILPCDSWGSIDPAAIAAALTPRTLLVSVMTANNEVGTINPIAEIGRICHDQGVVLHTDAAQAFGKIPLGEMMEAVDLLSISAHKLYGPKGVGALYVNRSRVRLRIMPLFDGGGHERGLRSGTLAVPLIVGLGRAAELAHAEMETETEQIAALRDRLRAGLEQRIPAIQINGHPVQRLAGNLNVSFRDVDGGALLLTLRGLAVSSGSACSSAEPEPSHVLTAMGLDEELARSSLRFGLGRFTTEAEIDQAVEAVAAAVAALRKHSLRWHDPDDAGLT